MPAQIFLFQFDLSTWLMAPKIFMVIIRLISSCGFCPAFGEITCDRVLVQFSHGASAGFSSAGFSVVGRLGLSSLTAGAGFPGLGWRCFAARCCRFALLASLALLAGGWRGAAWRRFFLLGFFFALAIAMTSRGSGHRPRRQRAGVIGHAIAFPFGIAISSLLDRPSSLSSYTLMRSLMDVSPRVNAFGGASSLRY